MNFQWKFVWHSITFPLRVKTLCNSVHHSLLIKDFPMISRVRLKALWFGRYQHDHPKKKKNNCSSQIDILIRWLINKRYSVSIYYCEIFWNIKIGAIRSIFSQIINYFDKGHVDYYSKRNHVLASKETMTGRSFQWFYEVI